MEIVMCVLKIIIMIIVPVATSVLTYLAKRYLTKKIDEVAAGETAVWLKQGVEIIASSVDYVQQTYVDTLKKQDSFTAESQAIALDAAKNRAIDLMNNDIQKAITNSYGDLDTYVTTIIESVIAKTK